MLATASSAIAGMPQQQRPQFGTTVEVVQMQVQIADSTGRHIPRLEADDFALRIDGQLRDLVAVYEVDLRQVAEEQDDTYVPPAGWRQFMLFFDFTFSTRQGILRAREAALEFVGEGTHPRDLIAVATYSNVGGFKLISPFTRDRDQVLDAIAGFGLTSSNHIVDPAGFSVEPLSEAVDLEVEQANSAIDEDSGGSPMPPEAIAALEQIAFDAEASDFRRYREEVANYASQLVGLGDLLTATRGRKHVLLFSAGFDDKVLTGQSLDELAADRARIEAGGLGLAQVNSETRFGSSDVRESLEKALQNLRASDTVFHAYDVGGLQATGAAGSQRGRQALTYLAEGTNGTVTWNANDLGPHLGRLAEETAEFYVLAYRRQPDDPPVVEVDVEVLQPGARVAAAPTRFSPPPAFADMDDAQRQLQLAEFVTKGIEEEDLTFDVRAVPFAGRGPVSRLAVLVEVPYQQLSSIAVSRGDETVELDVLGYVIDESGNMRDLFSRRVKLNMAQLVRDGEELPFRYYDLMWAFAGRQQVRVLVRDAEVGMLSTRTVDVRVPAFHEATGLTVTAPVAVDTAHPGLLMRGLDPASPPEHRANGPIAYPFVLGDSEITPQVYNVADPGGQSVFMLVAYNLTRHPFTGQTQVLVEARAIDELGTSHEIGEISLVGRHYDAGSNATTLMVQTRIPESMTPGAYLLEIDVSDAIGGQTVGQVLPLLVGPGLATDATQ